MDFCSSPSIRRLSTSVLLMLVSIRLSVAVAQNGNNYGTCIGNGGFDDSCPTGMYCEGNIGGTCFNCSTCYLHSFVMKLIPLKCQCDGLVTGSSDICVSLPAEEPTGSPIQSEEDVVRLVPNTTFNDFKGYFDGSAAGGLPCPAEPTTSSPDLTTDDLQFTPYLPTPPVQDHPLNDSTKQCIDPGDPVNGYKKVYNITKGGMIEFACNKSYSLHGENFIYCMEDGKWSNKKPSCVEVKEPVSCKDPGSPTNGFQIQKDYDLHGIVTFACNKAYILEGADHIQCTYLGWSDSVPHCFENKKDEMLSDKVIILLIVIGAVLVLAVPTVLVVRCYRNKVQDSSSHPPAGRRVNVENPPNNQPSNGTVEYPSEESYMLNERSETNSEETTRSSRSGSGSVTPENTSAVYLTDEDSPQETLTSPSIQQIMQMDSVYLSSMESCSEKLSHVAWTTMQTSLQTLLEDNEFKTVFLRHLFKGTTLSEGLFNDLCGVGPDLLLKAVEEQTSIYDIHTYGTWTRTLTDIYLRGKYPERAESMDKLVQLLGRVHNGNCRCYGNILQPSENSTVV